MNKWYLLVCISVELALVDVSLQQEFFYVKKGVSV
ncbi:MAG: hypothetical protein PWP07_756 [Epulopiscium sp.]|jgi:hypothetical protein|nr:hypothetical protein [Defluviitalea raffinosedens]MDK2787531.1 hypothetical protein [Candidatus Epulonipiscium sp.]